MLITPSLQAKHDVVVLEGREQAFSKLLPLIHGHESFLVTSHARPDGDAVGSALGTMHWLRAMGKRVRVYMADPVPRPFSALPGASEVCAHLPDDTWEVALVLECDSVARTGYTHLPASLLVNIDHHHSGSHFAAVNWIDPSAPAVGAMVYDLAVASGVPLSSDMADCLYAAILTDTVSFTLPSITAATFAIARHLLELGAHAGAISDAVYFSQRESKVRLLGTVLSTMKVRGPVAWGTVTREAMDATGAGVEDSEGIVQHIIAVEGVQAAALLRELPTGQFRASLRSKGNVNVAQVAEGFGGGGHRNASGCTLPGPLSAAALRMEQALSSACRRAEAHG